MLALVTYVILAFSVVASSNSSGMTRIDEARRKVVRVAEPGDEAFGQRRSGKNRTDDTFHSKITFGSRLSVR